MYIFIKVFFNLYLETAKKRKTIKRVHRHAEGISVHDFPVVVRLVYYCYKICVGKGTYSRGKLEFDSVNSILLAISLNLSFQINAVQCDLSTTIIYRTSIYINLSAAAQTAIKIYHKCSQPAENRNSSESIKFEDVFIFHIDNWLRTAANRHRCIRNHSTEN